MEVGGDSNKFSDHSDEDILDRYYTDVEENEAIG